MPEIVSPEQLPATKQVSGPNISGIANRLLGEIRKADVSRSVQKDNWERWYKKRFGIRPPKNYPWPGCANVHLPLVDKTIKKLVPLYTSLIDVPGRVAVFRPAPNNPKLVQSKGKAEQFFTHLVQDVMNSHPEALGFSESMGLGIDKHVEKGYVILKVVWDTVSRRRSKFFDIEKRFGKEVVRDQIFPTDLEQFLLSELPLDPEDDDDRRSMDKAMNEFYAGKKVIEVRYYQEVYDAPRVVVRDPSDIITPSDTTNLASSRWINDHFRMTSNDLKIAAKQKKFRKSAVDMYLMAQTERKAKESNTPAPGMDSVGSSDSKIPNEPLDDLKRQREGINIHDLEYMQNTHLIREVGFYHDIDGDGIEEKCIITFPDDRPDLWFRLIEMPYDHGEWPWIDVPFELIDERYTASRGVPEHLDHIQTILTSRHNFMLDSMTLMNSPVLKTVIGAVNTGNMTFAPGSKIAVARQDAVEPLAWDRSGLVFEQSEMASLKAWGEEYMGMIDHTLLSSNSPTQEARTKAEIQSVVGERSRIFSHNARIFLKRLRRVYEQIWSLWLQYGDEQMEIFVQDEPIQIRKNEFGGKFYIFPAATPETSGVFAETQAALQDIQLFNGDPMINQAELRNRYWRSRDPMNFQQIVVEPKQLEANQIERQVLELTQMELGFDTPIKVDDEDQAHLAVIQKYLADVQAGKRKISEETLRRVASHGEFHKARAFQRAGQSGEAEKARTNANQIRGMKE